MSLTVLHIIDSGGFFGAEAVLVELVEEQRRAGVNAIVCSIGLPGESEKALERVLGSRGLPFWPVRMKAGFNFAGALRILQRANAAGVQVLHSHGYKSNILFGFMPRAWRRMPLVTTLHGWTYMGGFNKMAVYTFLDALSLRFMDGVVIVSEGMLGRPELKGKNFRHLRVIENGIPLAVPQVVNDDPVAERLTRMGRQGPLIGSIGRLSKEKGFDVLLKAVAEIKKTIPDIQLALLGNGPCSEELQALAKALDIEENVWFAGYVENAGRYVSLLRVYVNSSFTEGMPVTLLEAMRARCPVVASNVGGIPQLINDGVTGLLCHAGDAATLGRSVVRMLQSDDAIAMAERAHEHFVERFSITGTANGYQTLYTECLSASCA